MCVRRKLIWFPYYVERCRGELIFILLLNMITLVKVNEVVLLVCHISFRNFLLVFLAMGTGCSNKCFLGQKYQRKYVIDIAVTISKLCHVGIFLHRAFNHYANNFNFIKFTNVNFVLILKSITFLHFTIFLRSQFHLTKF